MRRASVAAVVGVAVLGLAGCGGSEPTTLPVSEATLTADAPTPDGTATLPADWPSDVPRPQGLALVNAIRLDGSDGPTWSATYQGSGDAGKVYDEITKALENNGFTPDSTFGGGPDGGVSSWTKGDMRVQATVLVQDGQVAVNLTALKSGG